MDDNTGVDFPGTCLDKLKTKALEKLNIADTDKVVVEIANEKGEFIFRYPRNVKIGRCEGCYYDKPLTVVCKCKEVFYCGEKCRKIDERFHLDKCTAIDIGEDLSQFKQTMSSNIGANRATKSRKYLLHE